MNTDINTMRVIDMEHHFYTPDFMTAAAGRTEAPCYDPETNRFAYADGMWMPLGPLKDRLTEPAEAHIAAMDCAGISTALLQCSPGPETVSGQEGAALCRRINRQVYEWTRKYPGRFLGTATLPVTDPDEACRELERCVKEYGFVGWHTHSSYGTRYPDDEELLPVFRTAAGLGVFVYLHPAMPVWDRLNRLGVLLSAGGAGFTVDAMVTAIALIARGVFDAVPGLQVVLGHLGESLPFLLQRLNTFLDPKWKDPLLRCSQPFGYYFKHNFPVTTSGNLSSEAFRLTKDMLGLDRMMVGTDYPYESGGHMMKFLSSLDMTQEEREALYYRNAETLMGR